MISVKQAAHLLSKGGVVAVPTETVYGLAADATNRAAIKKIYKIKNRPKDNPLICHFSSFAAAKKFVIHVPDYVEALAKKFLPGPVSFLLQLPVDSPLLPATAGSKNVIIRVPNHPVFIKLLKEIKFPLAAPSANTSGKYSATDAEMVEKDLGNKIDGIIDGGKSKIGIESTIVDCRNKKQIRILRQGAIGSDEIRKALKKFSVTVKDAASSKETTPGSKYRHYSPRTPIHQVSSFDKIKSAKTPFAVLLLKQQMPDFKRWKKKNSSVKTSVVILGTTTNLNGIAKNLYRHFHELDKLKMPVAYILKINWGTTSIGKAIAEKMKRVIS